MPLLQPSSPLAPSIGGRVSWLGLIAPALGVAALVGLAFTGRAELLPALACAAAVVGVAIYARRRERPLSLGGPVDIANDDGVRGAEAAPYASLVNAMPDPILVVAASEPDDLTGRRYVFANNAARELLRIQRSEGLLVTLLRAPEALEAVDEALFGACDSEAVYETGGVQSRVLRVQARPLGLALDGAHLALVVFRDETEARRVERTRADFLANASHELRTPLASLSGFIETLRGHAKEDPVARDRFLTIMQAQAERMSRLIDDLLSLSRIELSEHIAPADAVDLTLTVRDVMDALTPLAKEKGVILEARLPSVGSARLNGDRDQITQIVQNLVDNALKYSPRGDAVRVEVECGLNTTEVTAASRPNAARLSLLTPDRTDERWVLLRVGDRGPGIAREDLPRLTERFYRVEGQKSGERSGTGLGLAIVKHITNRHRGGLTVESGVGEGAAFAAYFPMISSTVMDEPVAVAKVS